MGRYCACGVKKMNGWKCECDWKGWFLCFRNEIMEESFPKDIPIKEFPIAEGTYQVRVFEDGDDEETESDFSLVKKNWGEYTNEAVSHWKIEYCDGWMGYRGVYAWKAKEE